MLVKKLVITAAAGALLFASAAGVFASYHKTVTVTKVHVENEAIVTNNVLTGANTGLNFTSVSGGKTVSGNASNGGETGSTTGGNAAQVTTGDAGASTVLTNTVNTTVVSL